MVAKAPAKTPPRQRSKFSSILDALVATPPVKTEPLPEMRRTFVNQNPDEEFMRMQQMMNMRSPMKAPPAMAAPSAMRMHSSAPNMPSRQAVPLDPSLPFDPSMPIGVASMPGRRPAPAPMAGGRQAPAAPRPPEKRMDTLLRGIGNFLGYIPQGGSRGDRTEMIADFARGLLGEKPIREEEAELNQRMAEEMLRRALATGDVNEIARLDPDMAMKLQEFGTFDEDRADIRQTRLTQKQIDEAAIEENRILQARRVVEGLYEATDGDPERFAAAIQQISQEQPNIFNSIETGLAQNPDGMRRYFAVAATGTGSRSKPYAVNTAQYGPIMYDPNTGQFMLDDNGQPVRPYADEQFKELTQGVYRTFDPVSRQLRQPVYDQFTGQPLPVAPAAGPPGTDVIGAGFPAPPGEATPVSAPGVQAPAVQTAQTLQDEIVDAQSRAAEAKAGAEARGRLKVEIFDEMIKNEAPLAAFLNAIEEFEKLPDEDIGLITGMPDFGKAARGGVGGVSFKPSAEDEDPAPPSAPGTPAAKVARLYKEVASKLRLAGFNSVRGAGQVTQAESKFAGEALGALRDGRWSSTEDLMDIINNLKTTVILAQQTQQARLAALNAGETSVAMDPSDEAIKYLRDKYAQAQQPRAVASPEEQRNRVPAPNSGAQLPRATNSKGEAMVYRNGQWVPE